MNQFELKKWQEYLLLFASTLFFLVYLLPIYPGMPGSGLDPSWSNTINYALVNDFKFGSEIVFTFGPLGSLRFPEYVYAETTYYPAIIISIIFSLIVAFALFLVSKSESSLTIAVALVAIFSGLINEWRIFWYLIPLLFMMVLLRDESRQSQIVSLLLVLILAFSILVKFSHFPIVLVSVLLADLYYMHKRKIPIFTIALFVFWIIIYALSGQNISDFLSYFWGSFATLSGYSESMNTFGPKKMIYAFLVLFFSMFLLLFWHFYKNISVKLFLISFLASIVLFMAFKQGYVRQHDGHVTAAFSGMSIVFGLLLLSYSKYIFNNSYHYRFAIAIISITVISSFAVTTYYHKNHVFHYLNKKISDLESETTKETLENLYQEKFIIAKDIFVSLPYIQNTFLKIYGLPGLFSLEKIDYLNKEYENALHKIRDEFKIEGIEGTVDIYPWDQSYVIANKLDFTPRPLFQSYSVYTDNLIKNNIAFLKSDRAAENILFRVQEIDGRLPSTMEGASWLEILTRYDAIDVLGNFLHLKKSNTPRKLELTNIQNIKTVFDENIEVPFDETFIKIDLQKSFFGKIANTLFKTPILQIQLNFSDGTSQTSRIIPAMARNGFILTPYISNAIDFYKFGVGRQTDKRVVSFKLSNTTNCCYKDNIDIEFSKIEIEPAIKELQISDSLTKFIYEIQSNNAN
jgi:hypothetical protein